MKKELFHRIADPVSAAARRLVVSLHARVEFRNVDFSEHALALASHGGKAVPALWDGERLHVGLEAIDRALTGGPLR